MAEGSLTEVARAAAGTTDDVVSRTAHTQAVEAASREAAARAGKDGADAAKTRISTILSAEEAKGRENLAKHLAFNTDMAAPDAIAALKHAAAEKDALAGSRLDAAMRDPQLDAGGGAAQTPDAGSKLAAEVDRRIANQKSAG